MSKTKCTLRKPAQVGIYQSQYVARIYAEKVVVTAPYVKWIGNSGGYAERKVAIRDTSVIAKILTDINDGADDSAWELIGDAIHDCYLCPEYN